MKSEENGLKKGQRFGRWTLLDKVVTTAQGEKKHLCRCDCGTERYVLERSLKSGGSLSCGCLRRERAQQATAYDLLGIEGCGQKPKAHQDGSVLDMSVQLRLHL